MEPTFEEIRKMAFEKYPVNYVPATDDYVPEDDNYVKREAYISGWEDALREMKKRDKKDD